LRSLALYPLYTAGLLPRLRTLGGWRSVYTLGNSNLDVLLLAAAYTLLHLLVLLPLARRGSRDDGAPRRVAPFVRLALSELASMALLGKTVAIAMLADDDLRPSRHGRAGLVALFAATGAEWVTLWLQAACLARFAAARPHKVRAR